MRAKGEGSKAVAFNHVSLDTLAHIDMNNLYEWFGVPGLMKDET